MMRPSDSLRKCSGELRSRSSASPLTASSARPDKAKSIRRPRQHPALACIRFLPLSIRLAFCTIGKTIRTQRRHRREASRRRRQRSRTQRGSQPLLYAQLALLMSTLAALSSVHCKCPTTPLGGAPNHIAQSAGVVTY